jgi:hypothetical protein
VLFPLSSSPSFLSLFGNVTRQTTKQKKKKTKKEKKKVRTEKEKKNYQNIKN